LDETFEDGEERVTVLFQERCFDLGGAVGVGEGEEEKNIECSNIYSTR